MIILMAGLPGSGKSSIARELSARLNGTILSKDIIRHTLFESRDVEYSTEQDDFCMDVMLETAAYILRRHAGSHRDSRRANVFEGLSDRASNHICGTVTAAVADFRMYMLRRHREATPGRAAGPSGRKPRFRSVPAGESDFEEIRFPKTHLDTDQPLEQGVQRALDALI